ncbi:SET domain-containing protein [Acidithiobacillus montserratensis]|uniref:SET domain-containing protein n=1 Tax=Acidithiobacillus montserratensis TaxID=2729135 RepID=A0ACD5HL00_9PROT|nr:SET domain-containing protein [Acidithiobacillus montserratensis]MBU2746577.1 SET domain-containing protein [Acidithiobacillus montserratensis]
MSGIDVVAEVSSSISLPELENPAKSRKPIWPVMLLEPWLRIGPSPVHGFGAFANSSLPAGATIVHLDGQVLTIGDIAKLTQTLRHGIDDHLLNYFFMEWNFIPIPENRNRVLARPFRTVYSYLNHSRDPNCKVAGSYPGTFRVETIRDVSAQEELFLNYLEEEIPHWYLNGHGASYL